MMNGGWRIGFGVAAAGVLAAFGGSVQAGPGLSITGNAADYKIFKLGGPAGSPVAGGGVGGTLSVNVDYTGAPVVPYNESRVIYQFDISSIAGAIGSATFSAVLDDAIYPISSNAVDVYGSTSNRGGFLLDSDPLAAAEFDAGSYVKLNSPGVPFVDKINNVDGQRYYQDVTSFLQARYADYLNNSSQRWVFFRLQCDGPPPAGSAFYDFDAAEAGAALAPRLDIQYVPGPAGWLLLGVGAFRSRRRR